VTFTIAVRTVSGNSYVNGFTPSDPKTLSEGATRVFQDGTTLGPTCQTSTNVSTCVTACGGKECCCDLTAHTWKVQLDHLSEYVVGDATAINIEGSGSTDDDCIVEWVVLDPVEVPGVDRRGRLTPRHTCVDGDPRCDQDGMVNGSCAFAVGACLNVEDPRLAKCSPSDVTRVVITRPKMSDPRAERVAAAKFLRRLFTDLAPATSTGPGGIVVAYARPMTEIHRCTAIGTIVVPLAGQPKSTLALGARAKTSAGRSDSDRIALRCRGAQ
jgi:hypothetical protein